MIDWGTVTYFSREEFFRHKDVEPAEDLVRMLDDVREIATLNAGRDVPVIITSGIRPPDKDTTGDSTKSAHTSGHAVDIRARASRDRFYILGAIYAVGFKRIGIYDKHLHVDTSPNHDSDVCWWGKSK